jgi:hypothetical protein
MKSYKCAKKYTVSVTMSQDSLDIKFFKVYRVRTAETGLEIQINVLVPLDRGLESWYLSDPGREYYYSVSVSTDQRRRKGQLEVVGRSSLGVLARIVLLHHSCWLVINPTKLLQSTTRKLSN